MCLRTVIQSKYKTINIECDMYTPWAVYTDSKSCFEVEAGAHDSDCCGTLIHGSAGYSAVISRDTNTLTLHLAFLHIIVKVTHK